MFLPVALAIVVSLLLCRMTRRSRGTIGFLHPNSGGGGGGERVLWIAVKAFQDRDAAANTPRTYTIYTKPYPGLLQRVQEQFGITLDTARLEVKDLRFSHLTEPQYYPRFTLILQSVCGALAVFLEVVLRHRPTEVVIDTVGNAFAYPLFAWLCGCRVGTYTHYPTVSSDMLQNVRSGRAATNNSGRVAGSKVLSAIKVYYYRLFALAYGWAGRRAVVVTTNSTWTNNHIREVWRTDATTIVYPPVNATRLSTLGLAGRAGNTVVSVGQFRPEKDHELQIRAFYRAMRSGKCLCDARLTPRLRTAQRPSWRSRSTPRSRSWWRRWAAQRWASTPCGRSTSASASSNTWRPGACPSPTTAVVSRQTSCALGSTGSWRRRRRSLPMLLCRR
jgi:alpha-1,2-mannosyltransferase